MEAVMPKVRVVQVGKKGGPFELVERELPQPRPGEVRVNVQACGVCHSDSIAKEGLFPTVPYPIVPGHEIAGVIDAVGDGVIGWAVGTRVGVGWFGGHCGRCEPCRRRGYLVDCRNLRIPGISYDGGYAEAMVAPAGALALIPDDLSAAEAAPLLCAGVTTYNALRESEARPVAIARGRDKEKLARQLGAHVYLDSQSQDVPAELTKLGGAKTILSTVTSGKAMSTVIPGLAVRGRLVVVGLGMDPLEVSKLDLIGGSRTVTGHASGASIDSQDTLAFSALTGVRPTIETMPLERAAEAYDKMMRNEARFRMVLTTGL